MKIFPGQRSRFNTLLDMLKCVTTEDSEWISTANTTQQTIDKSEKYEKRRPKTNSGVRMSNSRLSEKTLNMQRKVLSNYRNSSTKNLKALLRTSNTHNITKDTNNNNDLKTNSIEFTNE